MMDSPLEALALNYLSYGLLTAVKNLWAWIAAVSFWRIRILPTTDCHVEAAAETRDPAVPARAAPCVVLERQGSTKMKFSVYYKDEEDEDEDEDLGDGGEMEMEIGERREFEIGSWEWEAVIALRKGDMGFYRWQDRTVLNGNVVRLWEAQRRKQQQVVGGGVVVW